MNSEDVISSTPESGSTPANKRNWKRWLRLAFGLFALVGLSFLLAYWFNGLINNLNLPLDQYEFLAYLFVFGVSVVANLTVLAPVPIAITVMITVATTWNPALTALAAAVGGTIGELSGYLAGYAGRKITVISEFVPYSRIEKWIKRYGAWAITFLAFQPLIPFDLGGIIAGAAKMPIRKFLPALFAGKLPKMLILVYAGVGIIKFLPESWFP